MRGRPAPTESPVLPGSSDRDQWSGPGLYLHVPFCSAICPYCDFSVLTGGPTLQRDFVDHMVAEVEAWAEPSPDLFGAPFDTLYFGGGTPSSLAPRELERILTALHRSLEIAPDAWLFLEANPEDVTLESVTAWRDLGVRTLCLGTQSFDAEGLRFLGRRHTPLRGRQAVELALGAGFATVSLDLIFGLPGQTPGGWQRDLEVALSLAPQHVSCYQLTIHRGTPFGFRRDRGRLVELPEETQADLLLLAHERLESQGYAAYEVSSFALSPEHRSRHNVKYWRHAPYLGLGPSAHSFAGNRRWWNERKLGPYRDRLGRGERPVAGEERLEPQELALEALMLGLRTCEGVDLGKLRRRWGLDLEDVNRELVADLVSRGLLRASKGRLRPSRQGLAVADALARAFEIPPVGASTSPPTALPLLT